MKQLNSAHYKLSTKENGFRFICTARAEIKFGTMVIQINSMAANAEYAADAFDEYLKTYYPDYVFEVIIEETI